MTGKRARESERDIEGEDDSLSTSHKLQRQIAEVTSVHATSASQSSMVNRILFFNTLNLEVCWRKCEFCVFCLLSRKVRWTYHHAEQNIWKIRRGGDLFSSKLSCWAKTNSGFGSFFVIFKGYKCYSYWVNLRICFL